MNRPREHKIDERGNALFRAAFADWGVNPSEKDYGWDYIVEVFRNEQSTGMLFAAQLKSSERTRYSRKQDFITQPLKKAAADYLARQLKQPTFLFHADVKTKRLFWSTIQLDSAVLGTLEKGTTRGLTVRISTANVLPDEFERFLRDLREAQMIVLSRSLRGVEHDHFVAAIRRQGPQLMADVAENLHETAFRVEMQTAHEVFRAGKLREAIERLKAILLNPAASIAIRFNVTRYCGQLEWIEVNRSQQPQMAGAERLLATAQELCRITKRGPASLKLFSIMDRLAAELGILVHRYIGVLMIWRSHAKQGSDPLWLTILTFRAAKELTNANRKYRQVHRLMALAAQSPYRWITPRAIVRTAVEFAKLAGVLSASDFVGLAKPYRDTAFDLFQFAASVAVETHNEEEVRDATMQALMIEDVANGPVMQWVRSTIGLLPVNSEVRETSDRQIERFLQRLQGKRFDNDIQTTSRQVHQNILSGLGYDPAAEPWAGLIDLAIQDEDPTRVLKDCNHTFIFAGPSDPLLKRLALERAGPKVLCCTLHGYMTGGPDFDGIKAQFVARYCASCPDRSPRADDWAHTDEWQEAENLRWSSLGG